MNIGLKTLTLGAALAGAAIISCPAKAITFSNLVADQKDKDRVSTDREPNYTANHCFNLGNRDGYRVPHARRFAHFDSVGRHVVPAACRPRR